jgi:hypothetical protein
VTKTLAVAFVLAVLAALWQWGAANDAEARASKANADLRAANDTLARERNERAIESKRAHRIQEALDAEHLARSALEQDVRRADAAAVGLRERARQLAAAGRTSQDSAAPRSCEAADAAGELLADLLVQLDEFAGEAARYADQARLAGLTCERAYEALKEEQD